MQEQNNSNRMLGLLTELGASKTAPTNAFPRGILPAVIEEMAEDYNRVLNAPYEFSIFAKLAVAASAIGNSYNADIHGNYVGISSLFGTLVGSSALNKSTPIDRATAPLMERESIGIVNHERELSAYLKAEKAGEKELGPKPVYRKLTADSFTPEVIPHLLKHNNRSLLISKHEQRELYTNLNAYSNGDHESMFLKLFDGVLLDNLRVTEGKSSFVQSPRVSICGGIQPSLLKDMAGGHRNSTGFIQRFLFVFADGGAKQMKRNESVNPKHKKNWKNIVDRLFEFPVYVDSATNKPYGKMLTISGEADQIHTQWYNRNATLINEADLCGFDTRVSIYGKFDIYIYRFALIVQLLNHVCLGASDTQIEAAAMEAAVKLIEYFRFTADKVQDIISGEDIASGLKSDQLQLYKLLPQKFTHSEGKKFTVDFFKSRTPDIKEETAVSRYKALIRKKELFDKTLDGYIKKEAA